GAVSAEEKLSALISIATAYVVADPGRRPTTPEVLWTAGGAGGADGIIELAQKPIVYKSAGFIDGSSSNTSKPIDPKEEPKSIEASGKPDVLKHVEARTTPKPVEPKVVKNKRDSKDIKPIEKTKFECTFYGKANYLVGFCFRKAKNALGP
ncbi:hypothetical protein E2562_017112, partial [Oryza meyeriana var. granulata]